MRLAYDTQRNFGRGQNSVSALGDVRPDELRRLQDARVSMDGSELEPRGGSQRTHATALNSGASGLGGIEFTTAAGVQQLVVFAGSQMLYSTNGGSTWTSGATGLDTSRFWSLAIMRVGASNILFCANGTNLYSWDGTTWSAIAVTGVPSTAKYIAVFNDRLYATGHNGVEVLASRVGDPTSATAWDTTQGAFTVAVQTHDNDIHPTGLFALGSVLLVFKRGSLGYIEGFGAQSVFVQVGARGLSRSVGCVSFRSIRAVGDDGVCFLSERGIEFYRIGAQPVCVSSAVQDFIERITWSAVDSQDGLPCASYWPLKREYQLAVPVDGATSNNARFVWRPPQEQSQAPMTALFTASIVAADQGTLTLDGNGYLELLDGEGGYDINTDASGYLVLSAAAGSKAELVTGYLSEYAPDYAMQVLFTADNGTDFSRPYAVGEDGFVRELETGTLDNVASDSSGGVAVNASVRFKPFTFGNQFHRKKAKRVRVTGQSDGGATATVGLYADGVSVASHILTFGAGSTPLPEVARIGGRGHYHEVELVWSGDLKVQGVELGVTGLERGA